MKKSSIAILGAGSWGTAVAIHLARSGSIVNLWGHDKEAIQEMSETRYNQRYLPDCQFPEKIQLKADLQDCLNASDIWIAAVPSHAFAELLEKLPDNAKNLAWLTKGLDPKTHRLLSDLVVEKWGADFPYAIIAGPSFAREVAENLPTALSIAGNSLPYIKSLQSCFHHPNLRAYLAEDVIGVQLSGAVKNVLAIACGISDGLKYGANTKAALITRGLAELCRLGRSLGAKQDTFLGLSGVGDIVLSCTDNQSRNRRFGLLLAEGMEVKEAEHHIGQVVEGKYNAAQVCALAASHEVDMPICGVIDKLLKGKLGPKDAVDALMTRPAKNEF